MDLAKLIHGTEKQQALAHAQLLAGLRVPVEQLRRIGHWLLQAEGSAAAFLACTDQAQAAAAARALLAWHEACAGLVARCVLLPRADDRALAPGPRGTPRDRNDLRRALALFKRCVLDQANSLALDATYLDTADALAAYGASLRVRSRMAEMEHYLTWAGIPLPAAPAQ